MSPFELYLKLGIDHIMDMKGYDHILFIITLCAVYKLSEWKRVLILITAFTIGHSVTLVLATLKLVSVSTGLIEFLIPLTIFLTALFNAINKGINVSKMLHTLKYIAALFFGLIHGLGFSNYLRSLLGQESSLWKPLLSFNIGIEIGQVIIVTIIMLITWLVVIIFKAPRREWNLLLSGVGLGIALILMIERVPW
jgi:hypothetical protein